MADVSTPRPEYVEDEEQRLLPLALQEGRPALLRDAGIQQEGRGAAHLTDGRATTIQTTTSSAVFAAMGAGIPGGGGEMFAARRWLWPNPGESDLVEEGGSRSRTYFEQRMRRLRVNNVFKYSLSAAAAMPYRNQVVADGWPARIQSGLNNIDGQGNDLTAFLRIASGRKFFAGIHFAIATLSQDGSRWFWVHVDASEWTNWDWAYEGGKVRLLEARIRTAGKVELAVDPNDYDATPTGGGYHVYRAGVDGAPFSIQEYLLQDDGTYRTDGEATEPGRGKLSDIPATPFYSSWNQPYRSPPRFADAAYDQIELVRSRSELDDLTRLAKEPIMVYSGAIPEAKESGMTQLGRSVYLHDPRASSKLEHIDAASIEALGRDVANGEVQVRAACLDPMMQSPAGPATATEVGLTHVRAATWLELSAKSDAASADTLLRLTSLLNGVEVEEDQGTVAPATGFMELMDSGMTVAQLAKELASTTAADGKPLLSRQGMWDLLKGAEVGVPDSFDVDEELGRVNAEGGAPPDDPPTDEP